MSPVAAACGDLRVPNQSEDSAGRRRLREARQPQTSKIFLHNHMSPALVSLPGPAGTVRWERGRASESGGAPSRGGGEEEAAVVVGALVGVGERGVGRVDADEVLGGRGGGGGVRVDGERQATVRGLDLPRTGPGAEAEDVVEGAGRRRVARRRGGSDGGGDGGGEGRRRVVEARGRRRRRGRGEGARPEGEEAGGERGARGDHACWCGNRRTGRKDWGSPSLCTLQEAGCRAEATKILRGELALLPASPPFYLARVAFRHGLGAPGQRSLWPARIGCCAA